MSYYAQISNYLQKLEPEADGFIELSIDKVAKSINAEAIDVFMTLQSMQDNKLIQSDPMNGNRFRLVRKSAPGKASKVGKKNDETDTPEELDGGEK